jgi:hypothetical protein
VKAAPVIAAWEMLTVAVPVFVNVRLCVPVLPTATLPKLRLVEVADSTPAPGSPTVPPPPPVPPTDAALVYPEQLERPAAARMTAKVASKANIR